MGRFYLYVDNFLFYTFSSKIILQPFNHLF
nr:MAG TPA_asm: hypothetical protein [Caudoviricetes sp.]